MKITIDQAHHKRQRYAIPSDAFLGSVFHVVFFFPIRFEMEIKSTLQVFLNGPWQPKKKKKREKVSCICGKDLEERDNAS